MIKKSILLLIITLLLNSCVAVKEYEKIYLNDSDMLLSSRNSKIFEKSFQIYRESASGANGSHSGGGCGCN